MSKRDIQGVLDNFLGTYTSRYSDHNGYWLFGMLVEDLGELSIDLLSLIDDTSEKTPLETATKLAARKFQEQMKKAGIAASDLQNASVNIQKHRIPRMASSMAACAQAGLCNYWL